jgi:hypothetical protein
MLRIRNIGARPIGRGHRRQLSDTHIHPGLRRHLRQRCRGNVDYETCVVVSIGFADDRD